MSTLTTIAGTVAAFCAGGVLRDGRLVKARDDARRERDTYRDAFTEADDRYVALRDAYLSSSVRVLGAAERIAALSVPVEVFDQDREG